jgi:hypothetical protein
MHPGSPPGAGSGIVLAPLEWGLRGEFHLTLQEVLRRIALPLCGALVSWLSAAPLLAAEDAAGLRLVRGRLSTADAADVIRIEVDAGLYRQARTQTRVLLSGFPLPGGATVDLELATFEVLTPDARLVVVDEYGEREVPRPDLRLFRGGVVGDPDSRVTLGLYDGGIRGSILTGQEEFAVGPRSGGLEVWSAAADTDRPHGSFCAADLPRAPVIPIGRFGTGEVLPAIDGNTVLEAHIAIDATYEWHERFGSLDAAQSYILNLMAEVSTIYEDEVNITLEIPFLRVFTTPTDPYSDTTNASTLLDELRAEWNANQTEVDRTVVHLFSVRPSGGAGVAYLDVLCHSDYAPGNSYDYGVSTLSAGGGSWEKGLVAHELGHNFSSPHTHCFVPEIDQCATQTGCYQGPVVPTVGTIMSYCGQSTPTFHPRVESERIRPAAEAAYPTCLTTDDPQAGVPDPPTNLRIP